MTNNNKNDKNKEEEVEVSPEDYPQWYKDLKPRQQKEIDPPRFGEENELIQTWTLGEKFQFELSVFYQTAGSSTSRDKEGLRDRIKMIVEMPDQMWFSIGFGNDMFDTDMIGWHADGLQSKVLDYFSTSKDSPGLDEQQDVEYYVKLFDADENDPEDYPKVRFLVYRDLDTGDMEKDYLITVGQQHDMVYAMQLYSSDWAREHNARGTWKMNFSSELGNKLGDIDFGDLNPVDPSLKIDNNLRTPVQLL